MKFTSETEEKSTINFLDVSITHQGGIFNTKVYRKPTFTGLSTHFTSFIATKFKISVITTLLNRGFSICKAWQLFHEETSFLINYFMNNGYPKKVIEFQIKKFLNQMFSPKEKEKEKKTNAYLKLPYYGSYSETIKNTI